MLPVLARREADHVPLGVDALAHAVDPPEAQRLVHRLRPRHARLAGCLLEVADPQLLLAVVMLLQPRSEVLGSLERCGLHGVRSLASPPQAVGVLDGAVPDDCRVGGPTYAGRHGVRFLRAPPPRGSTLLPQLRHPPVDDPRDRGAEDGHGPVRGPRRLDRPRTTARSRARPRGPGWVLRRRERGTARAPRSPREVHRGRGDGGVRPPPRQRGRRGESRPRRPRDPRPDAPPPAVPRPGRAARGPRRDRDRRGGDGRRAHGAIARHRPGRQRRRPPADRRPAGTGADGCDHARADRGRGLLRRQAGGGGQGVRRRAAGLRGGGADHPVGAPHDPVRGPRERAGHPSRERREGERDLQPAPRLDPRRARRGQVPAGRRVDRRPGRRRHRSPRARGGLRRHRDVRAGDRDRPRHRGHRRRDATRGGHAPPAGGRRRLLRPERGGAGRRPTRTHDRSGRAQARGVGLRPRRPERIHEPGGRPVRSRARGPRVRGRARASSPDARSDRTRRHDDAERTPTSAHDRPRPAGAAGGAARPGGRAS